MKNVLNKIERNIKSARPESMTKQKKLTGSKISIIEEQEKKLFKRQYILYFIKKINLDLEINHSKEELSDEKEEINKKKDMEDYCSKLSLEKINFQFEKYGRYPDDLLHPGILFFKFLAVKPEYEKQVEQSEKEYIDQIQQKRNSKGSQINTIDSINLLTEEEIKEMKKIKKNIPRLKLYIPDTIILNDPETNYWIYTDEEGFVRKTEKFNDNQILNKFKSPSRDENELLAVYKTPVYKGTRLDENQLILLNYEDLEKYLFSKQSSHYAIQRFVKCRGPKAFICRTVWRRGKPPNIYILTNKANYNDTTETQNNYHKYAVNSKKPKTYFTFYASSGKHLTETMYYMNNIVKFIESHSDIIFDELVGDFLKDEAGIWWFINLKAMKVKNIDKFIDQYANQYCAPNLELFISKRRDNKSSGPKTRKFDYQTKIKCKFCGLDFSSQKLKYNLTTKMILETDKMLKHIGKDINFIDRPDLKHTDCSMLYLPFRVCEEWYFSNKISYLLFETMNGIKDHQIEIANYFRIPVDHINFGVNYYVKCNEEIDLIKLEEAGKENHNQTNEKASKENEKSLENQNKGLYRIMVIFTDIFLNEEVSKSFDESIEFYLLFNFLGCWYKVKISQYYKELGYININFFKIFYVVCDKIDGFITFFLEKK